MPSLPALRRLRLAHAKPRRRRQPSRVCPLRATASSRAIFPALGRMGQRFISGLIDNRCGGLGRIAACPRRACGRCASAVSVDGGTGRVVVHRLHVAWSRLLPTGMFRACGSGSRRLCFLLKRRRHCYPLIQEPRETLRRALRSRRTRGRLQWRQCHSFLSLFLFFRTRETP